VSEKNQLQKNVVQEAKFLIPLSLGIKMEY